MAIILDRSPFQATLPQATLTLLSFQLRRVVAIIAVAEIKIADVIRKQWPLVALPAALVVRPASPAALPAVEDAATTTTTTAMATIY